MARRKRSRNKGYWFRAGRGWYTTTGKSSKPLLDDKGNPIRSADSAEEAKQAYARSLLQAAPPVKGKGLTVLEACQIYLDHAESGHPETYRLRVGFLFDFCAGLPPRFRNSKVRPTAKDRIHPGYGAKSVMDLTCLDVEKWVKAHPGWKSPRAALQAIRRALNYCKESGLIDANPVKGLKVPKSGKRVAYLTPETEEAINRYARPALATAIKVCIRVGARPDIEFARLEPRHVEETPRGQRWRFRADESKGGKKERTIYVPEEIAQIVRAQVKRHKGKVFRDDQGKPWTRRTLQYAFRRLKGRLLKKGVTPDEPFIPYTCRHTYAKRMLGGFWGAPVTLEVLAGLMGNTPTICWQHYAQWSGQYTDPFWAAIGSTSHNGGRETSPV
jgi:integrase